MTTPKVTEIIRNGNPVAKRFIDRWTVPPTSGARNPSG
jgi:hypothetical protein